MASNINPDNIDGTYPVEGENNDSQGFRTNFTNTSSNLQVAKDEIDELQSKSILKSAITGEPAPDNTLTVPLITAASTADEAGLNIPEGTAPTSPVDGDIWVTSAGEIFARLNGANVDLASGGGGGGVPNGGTTGQILIKQSASDGDATWEDQGAAAPSQTEYCPGYTFVYINTTSFSITGIDARGIFGAGRRLKFIDGASTYYGVVLSATFATNTTITMSMEGGDVLTNSITEVCAVTSATAWAPIVTDPFSGDKIWDIATGAVGGTQYWVAVGDNGKIFYSTDGGINWTAGTSNTTYPVRTVIFDSNAEKFWAGGQNSANDFPWLAHSTDGSTWTTVAIPITSEINDYIHDLAYSANTDYLIASMWDDNGTNYDLFVSNDEFATAITRGAANANAFVAADKSGLSTTPYWTVGSSTVTSYFTSFSDAASTTEKTGTAILTASSLEYVGESTVYGIVGQSDGKIETGSVGSTEYEDNTTFSNPIRQFCHSVLHSRTVCVGDAGTVGYIDDANILATAAPGDGSWTAVDNGFAPTANVLSVDFNESDGVFVAVADNGQICRSSNGLGSATVPTYSGWTAIAADPFSGGNIDHIATGTIAGTEWWVIASSTLIYTSTDAGLTWTSRTSGVGAAITTLGYNETNEQFVAGCGNGDFTYTNDGSTWTPDTTTLDGLNNGGSSRINNVLWDPNEGRWQFAWERNVGPNSSASASVTAAFVFTEEELIVAPNLGVGNAATYAPGIASRAIYLGQDTLANYWTGALDDTPTTLINMGEQVTAIFGKAGTLGDAVDLFIGDSNGDIQLWTNVVRTTNNGALSGPVNDFAFSSVANRMIAVGNAGEIKTQAGADLESPGTWYDVTTPFSGNINSVAYNATDDIFICVCADGVIARSTDGIS